MRRDREGSCSPPLPPVGSRAGAPAVGGGFPVPLFRWRDGCTMPPWPRFQPPPRQTPRAAFPHGACLVAAQQGLWDLSCWERFRHPSWALDPLRLAQAQVVIQPRPPPPLPAEALAVPCTPQVTSDLLCHPIFAKATTPARIPSRTRAHPAPQDRVHKLHPPIHRLGLIPAKHLLQLAHQCRALFPPGRLPRPPGPLAAP